MYEISYLIDGGIPIEKASELADKIRGMLETSRNLIMETTPLKLQKLAYPIKKHAEAFWGRIRFMSDPQELIKLKNKIEAIPEIMRMLTVEAKPDEASQVRAPIRKKKVETAEEVARSEEIDKKLEEILGT